MRPVSGNTSMLHLRKIKRSGLKINIRLSAHPILIMRRWIKKSRKKVTTKTPQKWKKIEKLRILLKSSLNRVFFSMQGKQLSKFCKLTEKLCDLQIIFTTRKLKTWLRKLKSSIDKNLKPHVVFKVTCNGCSSIYFGQTSRHVITRIFKIKVPLWDKTFLNGVVQRIILGSFPL